MQGFRKVDTDRWEFANEGFIKGQKHLLKNIKRRKHLQGSAQKNLQQEEQVIGVVSDEVDYNRLTNEVEILKTDKSALMQELVKLRERHESSQNKLSLLRERLQGMENNQQQLLSFLVMVMQSPGLLVQLLQPKENSWRMSESAKITPVLDNMLVRYQPLPEASAPSPDPDQTVKHDISFDKVKDFFMNFDFPSSPLDESYLSSETCGSIDPIRLPELDLAKLEQFLLSSPTRDVSHPDGDGDGDGDGIGDLASDIDLENFDIGYLTSCFDANEELLNMELLTEKMECLSPGNKVVEES